MRVPKTIKLFINGAFPRTESGRSFAFPATDGSTYANLCDATRKDLREDPRWLSIRKGAEDAAEGPLHPPGEFPAINGNDKLRQWIKGNVRDQRQAGYVTAAVTLPLGRKGNGCPASTVTGVAA